VKRAPFRCGSATLRYRQAVSGDGLTVVVKNRDDGPMGERLAKVVPGVRFASPDG